LISSCSWRAPIPRRRLLLVCQVPASCRRTTVSLSFGSGFLFRRLCPLPPNLLIPPLGSISLPFAGFSLSDSSRRFRFLDNALRAPIGLAVTSPLPPPGVSFRLPTFDCVLLGALRCAADPNSYFCCRQPARSFSEVDFVLDPLLSRHASFVLTRCSRPPFPLLWVFELSSSVVWGGHWPPATSVTGVLVFLRQRTPFFPPPLVFVFMFQG